MTGRDDGLIGVIGAYGAVGAQATRLLADRGSLRLGGRDHGAATALASGLADTGAAVRVMRVDAGDDGSLEEFTTGCSLVVNCAGPSHALTARVAAAAERAGADLVDSGGGDPLPERAPERAVFFAGALPGLSGLLPRWLAARDFDSVDELTVHTGVLDRFTRAGAEDYWAGVAGAGNTPLAAWRDGRRVPGALTRRTGVRLPHFPGEVTALPYVDEEGEDLAAELGLRDARWYSVVDGAHLAAALARGSDRTAAEVADDLCLATALDTAGRRPYVTFVVEAAGRAAGRPVRRTAVLRADRIAYLTGAVTAVAASAVLDGRVPPGAHRAAAVLDPEAAVAALVAVPGLLDLVVTDGGMAESDLVEEGAL